MRDIGTSGCWLSSAGNRIGRHVSDGGAVQASRKSDRLAHGAYTRGCPLGADRDASSAGAEGGCGMVCGRHPYVGPSRGRTQTFQPDRKAPPQPTRWAIRSRRSRGYRSSRWPMGRGRSRRSRRVMLERQGKRGGCPWARRNPRPRGPWRLGGELGGSKSARIRGSRPSATEVTGVMGFLRRGDCALRPVWKLPA